MQLHHIIPEAEQGPDTIENCIPLCLDCHEEVGSYNPMHPIGRKFTASELKLHRDLWFDFVQAHPEKLASSSDTLFRSHPHDVAPTPEILATVEPHFHEVTVVSQRGHHEEREVFAAKVRNQGTRAIYVDSIGFTIGAKKYPGLFHPYFAMKSNDDGQQIPAGKAQVFSCYGVKMEEDDLPKLDGMYLVTGTGHEFTNTGINLERVIKEWQRT